MDRLYFVRVNSGGIQTQRGHWVKTGKIGCGDLIICLPKGRFMMLEVKTPISKPNASQNAVMRQIQALGGQYHIVRSVSDVENILNESE